VNTGLTKRFREAQEEHVEQLLEKAGIPTLAERTAEGLSQEVRSLQMRQAEVETARRSLA
jgi:hypothetical protein